MGDELESLKWLPTLPAGHFQQPDVRRALSAREVLVVTV